MATRMTSACGTRLCTTRHRWRRGSGTPPHTPDGLQRQVGPDAVPVPVRPMLEAHAQLPLVGRLGGSPAQRASVRNRGGEIGTAMTSNPEFPQRHAVDVPPEVLPTGGEAADLSAPAMTEPTIPCEFTCGVAGSGKTYLWRERIEAQPADGVLAATTGIAAVNLNTTTLNSLLRYFDTDSLRDAYLNGSLVRRLREIRADYRRIVIDEVSMMDGEQLSILVRAALECNSFVADVPPLGLTLVGDFAQLPPVKARWAFESDEWHRFDAATTRLTKVW